MKVFVTLLCIASILALVTQTESTCPSQLPEIIDQILAKYKLQRANVGVTAHSLAANTTFVRYNSNKYYNPASNNKLLMASATILTRSMQDRVQTPVLTHMVGDNTIAEMCVRGMFDPSITDNDLNKLASLVRQRSTVVQQLVLDTRGERPNHPGIDSTWEISDVEADYGAAPSIFVLNRNTASLRVTPGGVQQPVQVSWTNDRDMFMGVRVEATTIADGEPIIKSISAEFVRGFNYVLVTGQMRVSSPGTVLSVTIANTTGFFLQHLQAALRDLGVQVNRNRIGACSESAQPTWAIDSLPIGEMLNDTMQVSDNLYAEEFFHMLGQYDPALTARESAVIAVRNILSKVGITQGFVQHDGSGLSRHDLVAPDMLVTLLEAVRTKTGDALQTRLPVAGASGTLNRRFLGTPAQGKVFAKTGTLTGVSSLSGYAMAPHYPDMVFSVIVNNADQPASTACQPAIDEIVLALFQLQPCQYPLFRHGSWMSPVLFVVLFALLLMYAQKRRRQQHYQQQLLRVQMQWNEQPDEKL